MMGPTPRLATTLGGRALFLFAVLASGCVSAFEPGSPTGRTEGPTAAARPVAFQFSRLDGGALRSDELHGRAALVVIAATYDAASQAAVAIAATVVRRHKPRLNGLLVVLEPEDNRPIAQAFAAAMDLPFPAVIATADELGRVGSFEGLRHVPSIVLLDANGRERWRRVGLTKAETIEAALRDIEGS